MTSKFTAKQKKPGQRSGEDWTPLPYQKQGVKLFVGQGAAGLFLDPGMRKTSISLAAIKILKKKRLIRKALVVAPVRACYLVWPLEIEKWNDFQDLTYSILHGEHKEQALQKDVDLYLINPEGLAWLLNVTYVRVKTKNPDEEKYKIKIDWDRFNALGFDILILDESTKFKNTNTERFNILKPILPKFQRRYILTGSPMPRSYMDLFGQVFCLDLGGALGQYISHYRNSYFDKTGFGGFDWKLREGADKEIQKQLKPLVLHFAAEDHLQMPTLVPNPIYVDLPPKARRMYDEMEEHLITDIEDDVITAVNGGVASMKCAQIANGGIWVRGEEERRALHIHDAKSEAVADLIEELSGQPALLNYEFGHDLERLLKVVGKDTPNMSGTNLKKLVILQKRWNNGEIPVMLGQPSSMGHALNLQEGGHHLIMPSLMWDWEVVDQWMRRLRRGGQKAKYVMWHLIISRGTIDEVKFAMMKSKDKSQKAFLNAMKTYISAKKTRKFSPLQVAQDGVILEKKTRRGGSREMPTEDTMPNEEKAPKFGAKKTGLIVDVDKAKFVEPKKEKATKAKKEKPAKSEAAPKEDKRKITLIEKKNPKREGSGGYDRYELYKANKTVAAFLEAGGTSADLRYDEAKGYIKVA